MNNFERQIILAVVDAMMEVIERSGDMGVPSGHLFSSLEGRVNIGQYQQLIDGLTAVGYITSSNHLLKSTGKRQKAVES